MKLSVEEILTNVAEMKWTIGKLNLTLEIKKDIWGYYLIRLYDNKLYLGLYDALTHNRTEAIKEAKQHFRIVIIGSG